MRSAGRSRRRGHCICRSFRCDLPTSPGRPADGAPVAAPAESRPGSEHVRPWRDARLPPHPGDKALSPVPDGGPAAHDSQPRPPPGLSWTHGGDSREATAPPCVSSAGSVQGCKTCPPRPASVWTALKGPPEASAAASSSAFTTQGHRSLRAWPRRCPSKVLGCEFLPLFTRVRDRSRSLLSREREREGGREGGSRGASHHLKTKPQGPPRRPDARSLRRGPRTTLPTARLFHNHGITFLT